MSQSDLLPSPDDERNPYAPPRADVELEPELFPADGGKGTLPFTIGDVLLRSWEIYRDRMGLCIGIIAGCMGMNFGAQMLLSFAQSAAPLARNPQAVAAVFGIFGTLGLMVFQLWIGIGQTLVMFEIARGRDASFGDVFSGGYYLLRVILGYILFGAIFFGVVGLAALPGGIIWAIMGNDGVPVGPIVLGLGCFAGVVVATILVLRLSLFYFAILDRDESVLDSLRISSQITRGRLGVVFVIYLLTSAINTAGIMACFIGLIFTVPYTALLLAVTYLAMTGQPVASPMSGDEPYVDLEPI